MTIFKFGGSNFNSKEAFESFLNIVREISTPTLIVVSALGKTTRRLDEAAELAEKGKLNKALDILEKLQMFTINLIELVINTNAIQQECKSIIESHFLDIINFIRNIYIVRELTPRIRDRVLAFGEKISSQIFVSFLNDNSIKFSLINADEIIITDNKFGKANPINEIINQNIKNKVFPLFNNSNIVLTQGFIGSTQDGEITTMGYESSNLTALLFAQYLDAHEITIWTDVEGVFNIDPNVYPNAQPIPNLSYYQAKIAAKYGNKLFYPEMIKYAKEQKILIYFRSLFNPEGNITLISEGNGHKETMLVHLDTIYFFRIDLNENSKINHKVMDFLLNQENSIKFVVRYNSDSYIFTDNDTIVNIVENDFELRTLSGLIFINPNILKIYKTIIEFSDLFINLDFRLNQIEDNVFFLLVKKTNNRDINNLIKILLNN